MAMGYTVEMTEDVLNILLFAIVGVIALLIYLLYISTISKVLETIGLTASEASTVILLTLFFGWISIPLFPYRGWWVGISIGGALIPVILCSRLLKSGRAGLAESAIGIVIVAYVTYFVTRAEEGVGIVADIPLAFAPALAAGLYSMSTFWTDMTKAAPLAYVSGVLGTLIGADVFRLNEVLSFNPPDDGIGMLSVGGANIFDMVYLTGIVAVVIAILVYRAKKRQEMYGFGAVVSEFERGSEGLPYAKDIRPSPLTRFGGDSRKRRE
ncbi:MAG: DUF1614 domain-containing protein [Methanobacteriota archaeon]|nr:MAG: DUF1614 domain-containing protein [Euryarchaeota archaeon]